MTDLSKGAQDMLLHIARIRPLPEPFPPEPDGRRFLAELLYGDLIEEIAPGRFQATRRGQDRARALVPCETCNAALTQEQRDD